MKEKIKAILFVLIFVGAAFAYAHIDKTHDLYDPNVETSEYRSTGVVEQGTVEQKFVVQEEVLDGFSLKCATVGDVSNENIKVHYRILDENEAEVRAGEVVAAKMKTNRFQKVKFEQLENCKGKTFTLVLQGEQMRADSGVSYYFIPAQTAEETFLSAGNETAGSLVLKTVSHRFDMETFIVVLIFILYIVVFIKFLYKLFR